MKIVIATGLRAPQTTGFALAAKALGEGLPPKGIKVSVVSFDDVLKYPRVIRHGMYFLKVFFASFGATVIYAQDPVSVGFPAMLAAKLLCKRFFLQVVGDYAWEQGMQHRGVTDLLEKFSTEYDKYPFWVRLLKRTQRRVALSAEWVIVPSEYMKRIVMNWGVPEKVITIVHLPFERPVVAKSKEDIKKNLGIVGPLVVCVGRLVPWEGFSAAVEIIPELLKKFPKLTFAIVGEGPDRSFLIEKIKALGVEKSAVFTGKLDDSKTHEYMKAGDVLLSNASYEGFSNQALGGFALGVPVVSTSVGGNTEVVEHGKSGVLFAVNDKKAMADAALKILGDSRYSELLVRGGEERLKLFMEKEMVHKFETLIKK
jgi:glycosyltransferase involved in cell wall biosynthesis